MSNNTLSVSIGANQASCMKEISNAYWLHRTVWKTQYTVHGNGFEWKFLQISGSLLYYKLVV